MPGLRPGRQSGSYPQSAVPFMNAGWAATSDGGPVVSLAVGRLHVASMLDHQTRCAPRHDGSTKRTEGRRSDWPQPAVSQCELPWRGRTTAGAQRASPESLPLHLETGPGSRSTPGGLPDHRPAGEAGGARLGCGQARQIGQRLRPPRPPFRDLRRCRRLRALAVPFEDADDSSTSSNRIDRLPELITAARRVSEAGRCQATSLRESRDAASNCDSREDEPGSVRGEHRLRRDLLAVDLLGRGCRDRIHCVRCSNTPRPMPVSHPRIQSARPRRPSADPG